MTLRAGSDSRVVSGVMRLSSRGSPVGRGGTAIAARDRQTPPSRGAGECDTHSDCRVRRVVADGRSGRGAEVFGERLGGCPPSEGLAWSAVQRCCDGCELLGLWRARSVPLGKYWRSSPLVFSLVARCQGLRGSQK
jgi:hypothetical protein